MDIKLKNKASETYAFFVSNYDKSKIDARLKYGIYKAMQKNKLPLDKALVYAIIKMGKLTSFEPSWLVPISSTRTTDGGDGSGNFGHAGRPGKVGGSGEGGGESSKSTAEPTLADIDEGLAEAGIRKGDVVKVFGLRKDVLLSHLQNRLKAGKEWKGVLKSEDVDKVRATKQMLIDNGMQGSKDFIKIDRALNRYDFINRLAEKLEGSSASEPATEPATEPSNESKNNQTENESMIEPSSFNVVNVEFKDFVKDDTGESMLLDNKKHVLRYKNNFCSVYMDENIKGKYAETTMQRADSMLRDAFTKIKSMYKESGENKPLTVCIGDYGFDIAGAYSLVKNTIKLNTVKRSVLRDTPNMRDTVLHEMIHMTDYGHFRNNKTGNFNMVGSRSEWFAVAHSLALTGKSEFKNKGDPMGQREALTPYLVAADLSNYLIKNYGKEILMDIWKDYTEQSILNRIMKLKDKYKIKANNWRELLYNVINTKDKRGLESRLLRCGFISSDDFKR